MILKKFILNSHLKIYFDILLQNLFNKDLFNTPAIKKVAFSLFVIWFSDFVF